jgi:uncharacterized membrane protein
MNPRNDKGEAKAITDYYLRHIQQQFYPDDERLYYKHRFMLIQAIAYPAKAMKEMGVWLPPSRIREILSEVIREIKHHGDTAHIKHFGAYFLHAVQTHIRIRREKFYEEGKTARALPVDSMPIAQILAGITVQEDETPEQTTDRLVEIASMFKPKRRQKAPASQMSLF